MKHQRRAIFITLLLTLALLLTAAAPALAEAPQSTVVDTTRTGSLTLYKYEVVDPAEPGTTPATGAVLTGVENDHTKPLPGVTFTILRTHDIFGAALTGQTRLEKTTDAAGKATFSDLPLGVYLVTETGSPKNVKQKCAPFSVGVPITNPTGDGWLYDVTVYPKNTTVYGAILLEKTDGDGAAIAGAEFDFQQYDEETKAWATLKALTTNANGQCALENLPAGLYRFVETSVPAPYLIDTPESLPIRIEHSGTITEADGKFAAGGGAVPVKLVNYAQPTIAKDVEDVQAKGKAYGAETVWNVKIGLPGNLAAYDRLVLTDTVPAGLAFAEGTLRVRAVSEPGTPGAGTETLLAENTDYRVVYAKEQGTLTVVFRDAEFAGSLEALAGKTAVVLSYQAPVMEGAPLGTAIGHAAALSFDCGASTGKSAESGVPEVHTGGIQLWKYAVVNDRKTPLPGARFAIYASEADARANRNALGSAVSTSAGVAAFSGLAYGADGAGASSASTTYWIAETAAPTVDGVRYRLLTAPIAVAVNGASHSAADEGGRPAVQVENRSGFELPVTGGTGTLLFTVAGLVLMLSAAAVLLLRRLAQRQK